MVIIAIFSLIIGIFIIIGNSLFIFHSKRNDPEKELDHMMVLYVYFFGILFIICAITALTWLTIVLLFIGANAVYLLKYKKYGKRYPIDPISRALRNLLVLCSIFLLSTLYRLNL